MRISREIESVELTHVSVAPLTSFKVFDRETDFCIDNLSLVFTKTSLDNYFVRGYLIAKVVRTFYVSLLKVRHSSSKNVIDVL
jgi:hypothetical protein